MAVTFLYTLTGGMLMVLATARIDEIAWRFLRLVALLAFALGCGCGFWTLSAAGAGGAAAAKWPSVLGWSATIGACLIVLLAPLAGRMAATLRGICGLCGAAAILAAVGTLLSIEGLAPANRSSAVASAVGVLFGALLLGSITVAWLLGHAYLTATKMTIAPLRYFSRLLSLAVALRIGFLVASVAFAWWMSSNGGTALFAEWRGAWLILLLRVGVGLVAVGLFAYLVGDCVRLRSTQSATGILYFGSLFAYVGELANLQLISQYGWPL